MENNKSLSPSSSTESLPFLHCRGTHYEVGFRIGSTFQGMIKDLLESWKYFDDLLKIGSSNEGQALMKSSLKLCNRKYPGYVKEIKGMADGAEIDFDKLFMLNIDSILCTLEPDILGDDKEIKKRGGTGCTSITCNKGEVILGHTEDALTNIKNHVYIISAEIHSDDNDNTVIEKFTTFCYAGTLMGYTMGYNNHGMVYSVNTIFPIVNTIGTPRAFLARALLGAQDLQSLVSLLKDRGNGTADGFNLNVCFTRNHGKKEVGVDDESYDDNSKMIFYSIEVAPPSKMDKSDNRESLVNVHEIVPGTVFIHCNRYIHINAEESNPEAVVHSNRRHYVLDHGFEEPSCEKDVREMLSDQTDRDYPVYNDGDLNNGGEYATSFIRTVATGVFNLHRRKWIVYTAAAASSKPALEISME